MNFCQINETTFQFYIEDWTICNQPHILRLCDDKKKLTEMTEFIGIICVLTFGGTSTRLLISRVSTEYGRHITTVILSSRLGQTEITVYVTIVDNRP